MAKLTQEERILSRKELAERLREAIEKTPRGISDEEIYEVFAEIFVEPIEDTEG